MNRISTALIFILISVLSNVARADSGCSWKGVFPVYTDAELMQWQSKIGSVDECVEELDSRCPLSLNDDFTLESISLDDYTLIIEGDYKGLISPLIFFEDDLKKRSPEPRRLSFREALENMKNVMSGGGNANSVLLPLISYNLALGRSVYIVFNEVGDMVDEFASLSAHLQPDGEIVNIDDSIVTEICIVDINDNGDEDEEEDEDDEIFSFAEKKPQFPGGETAMEKWLSDNIVYTEEDLANGVQGRVIVKFIVEKDGSVSEPQIAKGIDIDLDREALRVVLAMPLWEPGEINGKPVRCYHVIPVTFKIKPI